MRFRLTLTIEETDEVLDTYVLYRSDETPEIRIDGDDGGLERVIDISRPTDRAVICGEIAAEMGLAIARADHGRV